MNNKLRILGAIITSIVAAVVVSFAPTATGAVINLNPGDTVNLASLISNTNSVQIGDKRFADFFFSYIDTDGNPLTDLTMANVNLTALSNTIGFGVSFTQPLSLFGIVSKDMVLKYTATVTDPNFLISDLHLSITGTTGNGGIATVGEDAFIGGFGATNVGHVEATLPFTSTGLTYIVPPQVKIWVQKDINIFGTQANSFASLTIVDQTFSQIPEPSTVLLVGLGLLGAVAVMRKR